MKEGRATMQTCYGNVNVIKHIKCALWDRPRKDDFINIVTGVLTLHKYPYYIIDEYKEHRNVVIESHGFFVTAFFTKSGFLKEYQILNYRDKGRGDNDTNANN